MEFVAAKCPSCGAGIQVPNNKDFAFCTFCGANVKVRESVIMKSDVDTDNLVALGNVELQAKDYEEAMNYFTRVLDVDGKNQNAWMGKGKATVRISKTDPKLYEEAFIYFQNALDFSRDSEKEELINEIFDEYTGKEFYKAHIEILDKLVKLKPDKKFLLILISLLDSLEEGLAKSGNRLTPERQAIKDYAMNFLKENYPSDYEKHLRDLEKRKEGLKDQSISNRALEFERKKRALFSGKRIVGDLFKTSLMNIIVAGVIILLFDSLAITVTTGSGRFVTIFFVLAVFTNLGVFLRKRGELKQLKEEYSILQNPFKNMTQ